MMIRRRGFLVSALALTLSPAFASAAARHDWVVGHIPDKPFDIDLLNMENVAPEYQRQVVPFTGPEPAGTLVVDAAKRHIYFVLLNGTAVRYGTAVGRQGASWHGTAIVDRKAKWPTWTPTANMRKRDPQLPTSMKGGPKNPLGARALYLFKDGKDTLYRIHGTNDPSSIGKSASSGCIRMFNEHIFELFAEVPVGTRVVVR